MPWRGVISLESENSERTWQIWEASSAASNALFKCKPQVPTVDHGVAKVRNIRSYKTALADSIHYCQKVGNQIKPN